MTPLPAQLGSGELVVWHLDQADFGESWDIGEGAYRVGGRWNSRRVRAVYCSIDPATAILEVAVHKEFKALDTIPNSNWLSPGIPSAGQQSFGDALLARHKFVLFPSAVSTHSWNLIFVNTVAAGAYGLRSQEPFALDNRLHPPLIH
jgi:RES domain-containing protein